MKRTDLMNNITSKRGTKSIMEIIDNHYLKFNHAHNLISHLENMGYANNIKNVKETHNEYSLNVVITLDSKKYIEEALETLINYGNCLNENLTTEIDILGVKQLNINISSEFEEDDWECEEDDYFI